MWTLGPRAIRGNPDLKPDEAESVSVGATASLGAFGIEGLDLAAGVLNVGDRGPSTDPTRTYDPDLTLDSVMGRTLFLNATLSFGP